MLLKRQGTGDELFLNSRRVEENSSPRKSSNDVLTGSQVIDIMGYVCVGVGVWLPFSWTDVLDRESCFSTFFSLLPPEETVRHCFSYSPFPMKF